MESNTFFFSWLNAVNLPNLLTIDNFHSSKHMAFFFLWGKSSFFLAAGSFLKGVNVTGLSCKWKLIDVRTHNKLFETQSDFEKLFYMKSDLNHNCLFNSNHDPLLGFPVS